MSSLSHGDRAHEPRNDVHRDNDLDSLSPCCKLAYRVGRYEAIEELAEKMRKQME